MLTLLYILSSLLSVFDLILLARAICSWFPAARESAVYRFAFAVTEPVLSPVRDLLHKFEWARRCPIDLSFLVVILLVNMLSSSLGIIATIV